MLTTPGRPQTNDVGARLVYLLSTGNLQSRGGLDMSQSTGFTIVAERLNFVRWCFSWPSAACACASWPPLPQAAPQLVHTASPKQLVLGQHACDRDIPAEPSWAPRYIAHFRSVHRGAYFAQLRTTAVRKLLPDSWGFLCPVHTPDGAPCGLLSHLSAGCQVVAQPARDPDNLRTALSQVRLLTQARAGAACCGCRRALGL